jgi:hypothetical protein
LLVNKDVIGDITSNFEQVQQAISRMELDLLKTLLKRRSELLAGLVEGVLAEPAPDGYRARNTLDEVSRQNALIQARVDTRAGNTRAQLGELYKRGTRQKVYKK